MTGCMGIYSQSREEVNMDKERENNPDLSGIDEYPESLREEIIQARIQARQIIDSLDPLHISGWFDLFDKLIIAIEGAVRYHKITKSFPNVPADDSEKNYFQNSLSAFLEVQAERRAMGKEITEKRGRSPRISGKGAGRLIAELKEIYSRIRRS